MTMLRVTANIQGISRYEVLTLARPVYEGLFRMCCENADILRIMPEQRVGRVFTSDSNVPPPRA